MKCPYINENYPESVMCTLHWCVCAVSGCVRAGVSFQLSFPQQLAHPHPPLPLPPSPSSHMPPISPHSVSPSFHPTRDYWFTHNLLFNIREQTFQNLCNLSISVSIVWVCLYICRETVFVVASGKHALHQNTVCQKFDKRPKTWKNPCKNGLHKVKKTNKQ